MVAGAGEGGARGEAGGLRSPRYDGGGGGGAGGRNRDGEGETHIKAGVARRKTAATAAQASGRRNATG